jgi:hypothetical protein
MTNVELKTKSLFLRANVLKVENIFVDREDFLFIKKYTKITRRHLRVQMKF